MSTSGSTLGSDASPKSNSRVLSVAIVLAVIGVLAIAGIVWYTMRLKNREKRPLSSGPFYGTSILDRNHPATRIIPFGAPSNAPSFDYRPGEDMRIAYRRPDGAWAFGDSSRPFTPTGVNDLVNTPMSASSSQSFMVSPASSRPPKDYEGKRDSERLAQKDGYLDHEPLTPPPPAYQRHAKDNPFL